MGSKALQVLLLVVCIASVSFARPIPRSHKVLDEADSGSSSSQFYFDKDDTIETSAIDEADSGSSPSADLFKDDGIQTSGETEEGSATSVKTFENLEEDQNETNPFFFEDNEEMEEGSTKSDQKFENTDEGQEEINPFFFEGPYQSNLYESHDDEDHEPSLYSRLFRHDKT